VFEADEGIWQDFGVRMIGVDVNAINITENREQFKQLLKKLYHLRLQKYVLPTLEVKKLHKNLVFLSDTSFLTLEVQERLLCIKEDFDVLLTRGLEASPIHEVLIDKALMGWKEYELNFKR
jgi:carbamoyl-phosphate synthase large subunit